MADAPKAFGRSRGRGRGRAETLSETISESKAALPHRGAPPLAVSQTRPRPGAMPLSETISESKALPHRGAPPVAVSQTRPRPGAMPQDLAPSMSQLSVGRGAFSSVEPVKHPQQQPQPQQQQQQQQQALQTYTSGGGQGVGGGSGDAALGRGAMRGRRAINPELLYTRPQNVQTKQGDGGKPIQLQANYFKMLMSTDWCLYKYTVACNPEEDRTVVRKGLLRLHSQTLGGYIFDGTTLYTSNRLPEPLELCSTRQSDNTIITMTIRLVGDMTKGDENYLQFFNIIMRKCLEYLNLQLVGRNFFDAANKAEVKQYRLELWPGYETSIRQHERDILMCTEIKHKVMRQQTVLDMLNECHERWGGSYQERFSAMVIGTTVLTDYNNNTYRVDDVDYSVSPSSTFDRKGEPVSYKNYYKTRYNIDIRNASQPLLLSKTKPRDRRAGCPDFVYLVPELCRATGLTDSMRDDRQMLRELSNYTRLNPAGRIDRLMGFNRRLHTTEKVVAELSQWNMKLDKQLLSIPGRVLDKENIVFGRNKIASAGPEAEWTRELRKQPMLVAPKLTDWVVIVPKRCAGNAQNFIGMLKATVKDMAFDVSDPRPWVIDDDRANTYTAAIESVMSRASPQLIMCVLPNNQAARYSAIKKKCCIDRPVPSQCVLDRTTSGKVAGSAATKIAVQINCKIGGAPWSVVIPASGIMVAGFDVCHDTNDKGRDFGALVCSLDRGLSRYYSAVTAHKNGEELSVDLATNMCKAVLKYRDHNQSLPTRIVVYRDGVGEGQIPYVHEHEVENVRKKLLEIYGDPSLLKLAYIIVTKRLNTRLFHGQNNPPPGTVVDDVITLPHKYDFFIVPQLVKTGSVSPTGFSVISDNSNLNPANIQKLTFKLTHMYFNWSGTVRVPAPCQFAHKLAFLVSQSIHASPSNHLESLLYFL